MQEEQANIEELKHNEEFRKNLERLALEAKETQSVAKMYQVLDASLLLDEENEKIDELFSEILQTSFDALAQRLTDNGKFDYEDDEELSKLRAIYEHGIEKYSSGDFKGAKEIFLILHHVFDFEPLKKPLYVHIIASAKEIDFDTFFEEYVDMQNIDQESRYAYFVQDFRVDMDEFINEHRPLLEDALAELESLKA